MITQKWEEMRKLIQEKEYLNLLKIWTLIWSLGGGHKIGIKRCTPLINVVRSGRDTTQNK